MEDQEAGSSRLGGLARRRKRKVEKWRRSRSRNRSSGYCLFSSWLSCAGTSLSSAYDRKMERDDMGKDTASEI